MLLTHQSQNINNDKFDQFFNQQIRRCELHPLHQNHNEKKVEKQFRQKKNNSEELKQLFISIPCGLLPYDQLIIIRDKKRLGKFEFRNKRSEIVIGSHPMADIVLEGRKVSKFHAKIICRNGIYHLQDLSSQCGTYLNGKKISPQQSVELKNAASINIMAFQIRVELQKNNGAASSSNNTVTEARKIDSKPSTGSQHSVYPILSNSTAPLNQNHSWNKDITELMVTEIIEENDAVKTFRLVGITAFTFSYLPGQFVTLVVTINGQQVQRCYSMSSSPSRPQTLDLTIKRMPGGLVSNWLCDHIKPGDKLKIKSPRGNFSHLSNPAKKLLFIGAGSGVVPLMSMIRWQFDTASTIDSKVLLSFAKPDEILFRKELEWIHDTSKAIDIGITLTKLDSRTADWNGLNGRIDAPILTSFADDLLNREVFLCGSEDFIDKIKGLLKGLNIPKAQIHCESFWQQEKSTLPMPQKLNRRLSKKYNSQSKFAKDKKASVHTVTFAKSNKVIQVNEKTSLLAAAESEGLDIDFSCKTGVCAECMLKCLSGRVRMDDKCEIDEQEREQGWIFSCCAYAQSDLVIDA